MICPECGELKDVQRSHSRGTVEKILKRVTPLRVYRCHVCNWRGWSLGGWGHLPVRSYRTAVLVFLTAILFGTLLALYFSYRNPV